MYIALAQAVHIEPRPSLYIAQAQAIYTYIAQPQAIYRLYIAQAQAIFIYMKHFFYTGIKKTNGIKQNNRYKKTDRGARPGWGCLAGPNCPNWASRNTIFDRFYKVFDMAECHAVYSENLMLFDHFGGIFAFWAPNSSKFDRFYKVFPSTFFGSLNTLFY